MKCLKLVVVTAVVGVALFAAVGGGTAAAETILCTQVASPCPAEKEDGVGTEVKASLVSGSKSKLTTGYKTIECSKSSINAKVTTVAANVVALVEGLAFEECNCTVVVLTKGTLELEHISSTINATAKSTSTEITTSCSTELGTVHCIYATNHTDLGLLEGGNPADLRAEKVDIPRLTTDGLCTEKALWDVEYEVTSPKPLFIEPAGSEAAPTILCTEKASPCPAGKADGLGTEVKASLVSGSKSKLTTGYKNIECSKSSITAGVTSTKERISAGIKRLTFEECNCEVNVLTKGTLQLEHIASTANATIKSTGTEITTSCSTIFGTVHCIYQTNNTDLGTLEGGNPAKIKISELYVPNLETSALCPEKANWDVEYEVTSPKPLYVEPE